jgi:hypothetical protein
VHAEVLSAVAFLLKKPPMKITTDDVAADASLSKCRNKSFEQWRCGIVNKEHLIVKIDQTLSTKET